MQVTVTFMFGCSWWCVGHLYLPEPSKVLYETLQHVLGEPCLHNHTLYDGVRVADVVRTLSCPVPAFDGRSISVNR